MNVSLKLSTEYIQIGVFTLPDRMDALTFYFINIKKRFFVKQEQILQQ